MIRVYPVYYLGKTLLIFAHSEEDAKIPYDRIAAKTLSPSDWKKKIEEGKDIHINDGGPMVSGPHVSYKDLLHYIDAQGLFKHSGKHHEKFDPSKEGKEPTKKIQANIPIEEKILEHYHDQPQEEKTPPKEEAPKKDLLDMFG